MGKKIGRSVFNMREKERQSKEKNIVHHSVAEIGAFAIVGGKGCNR